jgi:hypothetical protein
MITVGLNREEGQLESKASEGRRVYAVGGSDSHLMLWSSGSWTFSARFAEVSGFGFFDLIQLV